MALIGSISIGMSTNLAGLTKGLSQASQKVSSFGAGIGASISAPLSGIGGAAVAATAAVAGFVGKSIMAASDLNESISKTEAILGDSAPAVKAFANEMGSKFGLVKQDVLDLGSEFGGLGKSLGKLSGSALSDFATKFTKSAADLSSQQNMSLKDAGAAIKIGLRGGQSDVLEGLGAIVNETTVKAYALAHGLGSVNGQLSAQDKLTARAALITQGLADSAGDLERTQGGVANQLRKVTGNVTNLATEFGAKLLPAVQSGLEVFSQLFDVAVQGYNNYLAPVIDQIVSGFTEGFKTVGVIVSEWSTFWEIAGVKAQEMVTNTTAYLEAFGANFVQLTGYLADNWKGLFFDMFRASVYFFEDLGKNAASFGTALWDAIQGKGFTFNATPLLEGFEATAKQLPDLIRPELVDASERISELSGKLSDSFSGKTLEKLNKTLPIGKMAKATGEIGAMGASGKFAAAAELGSKEAYSAIIAHQAGGDKDASKEIAKTGKEQLTELKKIGASLLKPSTSPLNVFSIA
jgi:hypothetical protein